MKRIAALHKVSRLVQPFKRLSLLTTVTAAFSLSHAAAAFEHQSPVVDYQDVFNIEYAAAPQFSPDGELIVYERRSADIMTDGTRTNLWQYNLDDNTHQPLFSGKSTYRMARFSPSGDRLAYLSTQEGDYQLYVRYLATGTDVRVTNLEQSPSGISWSPNGKFIAFSMFKKGKAPGLFKDMPAKPKGAKWAGKAKYIDQMNYRSNGGGYNKAGFNHVYVVPSEGGTPRQVTKGDFHFNGQLAWSKDNNSIFLDADLHENWQDRPYEADIYRINVKTGEATNITNRQGPDSQAKLSPNGKKIAYLRIEDRKLSSQNAQLFIMNTDGSNPVSLTKSLDRAVGSHQWAKNGKGLYFSYDDHGEKQLAYVDLKGKVKNLNVTLGGQSIGRPYTSGQFAVNSKGEIAFTQGVTDRPADLVLRSRKGKVKTITALNEDIFAHKALASVSAITVKSSVDQRDIEGWIALPPNFDANKKYPLILEIHGGPHAAYGPNFSLEVQLMAAKGYIVVWANPRGSTSYGEDFANLIHHNYPSQDYNDLMDVVDGVIAQGNVDENNLFVTGGSGGGVLTAWIIGKTDRFKAAVVAKPVINWLSFGLTADGYSYYTKYWMPGMPWDHVDHLWKHSPLSLVGNVKTPTMLITGEVDYRTPMSETEQYYQALQLQHIESAMVRIPKAHHGIAATPSNLIQKIGNVLAWFEKYRTK